MAHAADFDLVCQGRHGDPFAVLGPHRDAAGGLVVRAFLPGARAVVVLAA